MVIRGISSLPNNFPVSDAIFQKAMGPDKTIASEAAKGNLFLADYAPPTPPNFRQLSKGYENCDSTSCPFLLAC